MLLILGGLPAVGKTAIATRLSREINAVHLRIDSIEQALRNCNVAVTGPEGYVVAYAIAEDSLRVGLDAIADSVNPVEATRSEWRRVARQAGKPYGDRDRLFRPGGAPPKGRVAASRHRRTDIAHLAAGM